MLVTIARVNEALNGKSQLLQSSVFVPRIHELSTPHAHDDDDNRQDISYLIIVIFFTLTQFLENKIYTEKRQFFALNL